MAAFNKFQQFVDDLANGVHDLIGTDHTLNIYLTNTAPNAATHAVKADLAEIATPGHSRFRARTPRSRKAKFLPQIPAPSAWPEPLQG